MHVIIEMLDGIVESVKTANYLRNERMRKFEFYLIICLEISRCELLTHKKISDHSAAALNQLFTFQVFEYYYRDEPELYKRCRLLMEALTECNDKLKIDNIGVVGVKDRNWKKYFSTAINKLIDDNEPNNT